MVERPVYEIEIMNVKFVPKKKTNKNWITKEIADKKLIKLKRQKDLRFFCCNNYNEARMNFSQMLPEARGFDFLLSL